MGLKDLKLPTETVEVPGAGEDGAAAYFSVRGLSFSDLRILVVKYSGELASIFDLLANGRQGEVDVESASALVADFIQKFPAVAAEIIAVASGEPDSFETALALPFPIQTEAIQKIVKLTFATESSVKKFVETVSSLFSKKS